MALDLWFREDVARILMATYETMRTSTCALTWQGDDSEPQVAAEWAGPYQQGFTDAVRALALAFGVSSSALAEPFGSRASRASRPVIVHERLGQGSSGLLLGQVD